MRLVIIFLNKIEYLEDILSAFLEIGVTGSTVLDSEGMGHIISDNIPIFAGLRDTFAGSSPSNKTIITVVEKNMVNKVADIVEDVCGVSLEEPGTGVMISIPVEKTFGI